MKRILHISILAALLTPLTGVSAQEMLIINDTIEWTMSSTHGYYFFQPPSSAPSNWRTPNDYYNGQWYTRYEIISEATDEPCGLQVGIWQWRLESSIQDGEKTYSEIMASIVSMDGPGDVSTANSSPNSWWRSYEGVDFNRVGDFWRLGINIWSLNPRSVIASTNWGGSNDLWAVRDKWFPIKVYVTVVAVAQGHSFSGWDNYVDGTPPPPPPPPPPPTPDYTINYTAETTTESVPSTDEYSTSSNMSNATSGTNQVVNLTPGQNLYFRTKASGSTPASGIQTLVVPARPAKPSFTYDPDNERTSQTVSSEYRYATSSSMSDALSGTGTYVSFAPGTKRFFQKKATGSAFASSIQELVGYSLDPPAYQVDYINERTATQVSAADEYSFDNFATDGIAGDGEYLALTPGENVWFRRSASGSIPASNTQLLTVPGRPEGPAVAIDFNSEATQVALTAEMEYRLEGTGWTAGAGEPLPLSPGASYRFRMKASESAFQSDESVLDVPSRPAQPAFEIDFVNEATSTAVSEEIEFAQSSSFSPSETGNNEPVTLTPGTTQYFRVAHTDASFRSEPQTLVVPQRPLLTSDDASDTIAYSPFTVYALFGTAVTGFDLAGLVTTNVEVSNLSGEYTFEAHPSVSNSEVSITIPANMVGEGNFASETLTKYFDGVVQSGRAPLGDGFEIYPNPFSSSVHISMENIPSGRMMIRILDITGKLVVETTEEVTPSLTLDLSHLQKGLYVIQLRAGGETRTRMIQKVSE